MNAMESLPTRSPMSKPITEITEEPREPRRTRAIAAVPSENGEEDDHDDLNVALTRKDEDLWKRPEHTDSMRIPRHAVGPCRDPVNEPLASARSDHTPHPLGSTRGIRPLAENTHLEKRR